MKANQDSYGATLQFQYKRTNAIISYMSPSTSLFVGGMQGTLKLENAVGITNADQFQISFGTRCLQLAVLSMLVHMQSALIWCLLQRDLKLRVVSS